MKKEELNFFIKRTFELQNEGYMPYEAFWKLQERHPSTFKIKTFQGFKESLWNPAQEIRKNHFLESKDTLEEQLRTIIFQYQKAIRQAFTGIITTNSPFPLYKPNPEAAARILSEFISFSEKIGVNWKQFVPENLRLKEEETKTEGQIVAVVREVVRNNKQPQEAE